MSTYISNEAFILTLQISSIVGFLFLAIYTIITYTRFKNRVILYISLGFFVIAISIFLRIVVVPIIENLLIEEAYFESIFEASQFLAAFFFFYGLKIMKKDNGAEN